MKNPIFNSPDIMQKKSAGTPKDDLISMFYMVIYFAKGNLPWNSIPYTLNSENYKKENKICQVIKTGISEEILCKDLFKDLVFIKQLVFSNKL